MALYSFDQFRVVLKKLGFEKLRSRKHETWRKILPNGVMFRVRVSYKHKEDVPKWLFYTITLQHLRRPRECYDFGFRISDFGLKIFIPQSAIRNPKSKLVWLRREAAL